MQTGICKGKTKKKHFFLSSFLCVLVYELAELFIESLIVTTISNLLLKVMTALIAVAGTHTVRIAVKAIIKNITYKEGTDKMEKIKAFFSWIFANKKSLGSTIVGATGAGLGITASWTISSLPAILIGSFNIAPIVYTVVCLVCFVLNELGVCGKGFEKVADFIKRKEAAEVEKAAQEKIKADKKAKEKEAVAVEKAAQEKIKADEKATKEKIEADKKAKEEAEFNRKVEARKAEILRNSK